MQKLISATLILVGIIHLIPMVGLLGSDRLASLYGIDASEPNLQSLMRRRAVLFALLGGLLFCAAFNQKAQPSAFIAGLLSVVSLYCSSVASW